MVNGSIAVEAWTRGWESAMPPSLARWQRPDTTFDLAHPGRSPAVVGTDGSFSDVSQSRAFGVRPLVEAPFARCAHDAQSIMPDQSIINERERIGARSRALQFRKLVSVHVYAVARSVVHAASRGAHTEFIGKRFSPSRISRISLFADSGNDAGSAQQGKVT